MDKVEWWVTAPRDDQGELDGSKCACCEELCFLNHPYALEITKADYDLWWSGGTLNISMSLAGSQGQELSCSSSFSESIDIPKNNCRVIWSAIDETSGQPQSDYQDPCNSFYLYSGAYLEIQVGVHVSRYFLKLDGWIRCYYNLATPTEYACGLSFPIYTSIRSDGLGLSPITFLGRTFSIDGLDDTIHSTIQSASLAISLS
jgi:hypothetical protein